MHISLGFPDLRDNSSLSLLRRVQLGIQRVQALKQSLTKRTRLPITLGLLDQLCSLSENTKHPNHCLLWAVAALYFAGFFALENSSQHQHLLQLHHGVSLGVM